MREKSNESGFDLDFELGLANADNIKVVDKNRALTMQSVDLLAELTGEDS